MVVVERVVVVVLNVVVVVLRVVVVVVVVVVVPGTHTAVLTLTENVLPKQVIVD